LHHGKWLGPFIRHSAVSYARQNSKNESNPPSQRQEAMHAHSLLIQGNLCIETDRLMQIRWSKPLKDKTSAFNIGIHLSGRRNILGRRHPPYQERLRHSLNQAGLSQLMRRSVQGGRKQQCAGLISGGILSDRMPSIRGNATFKSAESGPEPYAMAKKRSDIIPLSDVCFGESAGHMQGSKRYIRSRIALEM
jgi:hypothetical protein